MDMALSFWPSNSLTCLPPRYPDPLVCPASAVVTSIGAGLRLISFPGIEDAGSDGVPFSIKVPDMANACHAQNWNSGTISPVKF